MIALIVGSTGAGKTTYSRDLAKRWPGVVYSIDDWMKSLYWPDMPSEPDMNWFSANHQWYVDRIGRCESVILREAIERARLNQKSILDLGFSTAEHRTRFIRTFNDLGIPVETHYLDLDADLRWKRVQERNSEKGSTFVMHVDRPMFEFMESIFEPPSASEGAPVRKVGS